MHIGKELEAHYVEKGRLSCDSDAPQIGSARFDWTRVVKVSRRKTNPHKTRPYSVFMCVCVCVYTHTHTHTHTHIYIYIKPVKNPTFRLDHKNEKRNSTVVVEEKCCQGSV